MNDLGRLVDLNSAPFRCGKDATNVSLLQPIRRRFHLTIEERRETQDERQPKLSEGKKRLTNQKERNVDLQKKKIKTTNTFPVTTNIRRQCKKINK